MLVFNRQVTALLRRTSDLAHLVISLALVAATLIIAVYFFHEVYAAVKVHSLIKGVLHALGILLLLWTMVELISTESVIKRNRNLECACRR